MLLQNGLSSEIGLLLQWFLIAGFIAYIFKLKMCVI